MKGREEMHGSREEMFQEERKKKEKKRKGKQRKEQKRKENNAELRRRSKAMAQSPITTKRPNITTRNTNTTKNEEQYDHYYQDLHRGKE